MGSIRQGWGGRRPVLGAIAASALAAVLTGCQEGSLTLSTPTTSPTAGPATKPAPTGPETPSTQVNATPASQLSAADYVLAAGPETAGFESSGGADDPDSDGDSAIETAVATCAGFPEYNPPEPSDETTGDLFTSTEESDFQAVSRAKILPASQIRQNAEIVTSPLFGDCYRAALEEQFAGPDANGYTYELVAVETPPPPPGATALIRTSLGVTDQYGTYGYVRDTLYFYVGEVAVQLEVINVQNVPPPDIEQGFVDQIADRLTNQ
ncbi:hypothetical protein CcI49_17965 [Frankia sp. CcI49]|uniref:hypothetical protein n=1 Tax=Frankia sp. CcI49 TaxID=1745382 RepID=UPI0009762B99|nr:hypothetical protein [Frankia sp. CcI49]ONH59035.1 hypothetical protein CcI49_17965 [Frankia sp. CcI49]